MPARACGTIFTAENAMISRNAASTISAMAPAVIAVLPSLGHERRGAPDLDHLHAGARLIGLVLEVRARGPHLAVDAHAAHALVVGDALHDGGVAADERRRPGADLRRHPLVRAGQ